MHVILDLFCSLHAFMQKFVNRHEIIRLQYLAIHVRTPGFAERQSFKHLLYAE